MQLQDYTHNLFETGSITVSGKLAAFSEEEIQETIYLLKDKHAHDVLEMPAKAPGFDPEAALWGAAFLYRAIQLLMLRDLGEEEIILHLKPSSQPLTPAVIYSTDLTLRNLPPLLALAKGLAPGDPLVKRLNQAAAEWPFSSVGIAIPPETDLQPILDHPSLRIAYVDRIIEAHDAGRVTGTPAAPFVQAALGAHAEHFWPELALQTTLETYGNEQ